ncbi:hypothetical protein KUTeg_016562 [Tegillarca granosa]|uniref:Nardilysin n=1 Tax=Tegillarca granosa TaxID=220873 RepID=A0ABQ9EQ05_TEGGR|nr:hypothetical protein KUTeg_016562 [Tegillarca granosa]
MTKENTDHVDTLSDHEMSQDEASGESGEESGHESDMSDCDMEGEDGISHGMPLEHNEKKSAAALCIGTGSFSDPEDIPGFAHFLEHMVFMGSEKYPKENELDDFLGKHGGYSNAWTDCERTCFYFEIERKYFYKALDKFAQFFICPLLLENAVDREIQAVDSVIPVKNTDKLVITWAYPPLLDKYRYKPLDYLSVLLSHEGKGSILSYLRKKFWATSIVGGTSFDGLECNSTWTCFSLEVTLTDKGFNNYLQVIQVIFAYINILKREGPKKWIFDEHKMIDDTRFRWKEQIDPIDYVEKIAENMQMFEEEDILTGRLLLFEYDEKAMTF